VCVYVKLIINYNDAPLIKLCLLYFFVAIGRLCEKCKFKPAINCTRAHCGIEIQVSLLLFCSFVFVSSTSILGDGKCVICDSYVRPHVLVHICDECNYGSFEVLLACMHVDIQLQTYMMYEGKKDKGPECYSLQKVVTACCVSSCDVMLCPSMLCHVLSFHHVVISCYLVSGPVYH
jgi:hypothetical protein